MFVLLKSAAKTALDWFVILLVIVMVLAAIIGLIYVFLPGLQAMNEAG